eukprot:TRINITY_DN2354_c0_g1_i1.p1 TRINITY_DN2354_c0_g1~~TRINITY_DN2354_c0_g1_i1.p1  ORF type:complete len:198 (+),score=9.96 TRINITY_DN2354_c0_g1_i1:157-750(+)
MCIRDSCDAMGGCRSSARSSSDARVGEHAGVKPSSRPSRSSQSSSGMCDRCDGPHPTESCPIFRNPRGNHPDATRRKPMDMGGGGGNMTLVNARVVRQPGDGSCLFHSLAHGVGSSGANSLRRDIANFIQKNPNLLIAETPLKDWVRWDSGSSVNSYASRMRHSGGLDWGLYLLCLEPCSQDGVEELRWQPVLVSRM